MKKKFVTIFSDDPVLSCECCGKNLLQSQEGNFIVLKNQSDNKFARIKYACKEHDETVTKQALSEGLGDAGWDDIDDLLIPVVWVKKLMAFMNELYDSRDKITEEYFDNVKKMFLNTFPYVSRDMTKEEWMRFGNLMKIEL